MLAILTLGRKTYINTTLCIILFIILILNFITLTSKSDEYSLISTIFIFACLIISVIFYKNNVFILTFSISMFLAIVAPYGNLTSCFFALMAIGVKKNLKMFIIFTYILCFCISFSYRQFVLSACIAHMIGCVFCYLLHNAIFNKTKPLPVDVTVKERKILFELCEGKQQKEITFYSQAQVSKLLKSARDRNDCKTNQELIIRYKQTE